MSLGLRTYVLALSSCGLSCIPLLPECSWCTYQYAYYDSCNVIIYIEPDIIYTGYLLGRYIKLCTIANNVIIIIELDAFVNNFSIFSSPRNGVPGLPRRADRSRAHPCSPARRAAPGQDDHPGLCDGMRGRHVHYSRAHCDLSWDIRHTLVMHTFFEKYKKKNSVKKKLTFFMFKLRLFINKR